MKDKLGNDVKCSDIVIVDSPEKFRGLKFTVMEILEVGGVKFAMLARESMPHTVWPFTSSELTLVLVQPRDVQDGFVTP